MKVFLSWSGEPSRRAAELMKTWLPSVIQESEVWVSSQDIGKGARWSEVLWECLSEIEFGILMVTRANFSAPWIMFEAGALSKTVKAKVIPILCDLNRIDIADTPLTQFQNSLVTKEEIWQLIVSVNASCQRGLDEGRLKTTFEKWREDFHEGFSAINFEHSAAPKPGGAEDQVARLDKIEKALESIMSTLAKGATDANAHNHCQSPEGSFSSRP
jgi:hypothetical protein